MKYTAFTADMDYNKVTEHVIAFCRMKYEPEVQNFKMDSEMISGIPVVDFSAFSLKNITRPSADNADVQVLAKKIYHAFSTVGFVYLVNHGISENEIDSVFAVMHQFFNLDRSVKEKYHKWDDSFINGWEAMEEERTNPDRPPDLKESFDIGHIFEDTFKWPDEELPDFKPRISAIHEHMTILSFRVLSAIAVGLGMDIDTFTPFYQKTGKKGGMTQLRLNYYPKINEDCEIKQDQMRCGEHTDYGGISMLFQDDCGGLEVKNVDGEYVRVTPIKGGVVVNIADLVQRWTSDKLIATYHRVVLPETIKEKPRCSAVLFLRPDRDATIECLDGQHKYPAVNAGDFIDARLKHGYMKTV